MGNSEIIVRFNESTERMIVVTTLQMMIMLLFNKKEKLKFSDIERMTSIPSNILGSQILPLAHPKVRVLLKKPDVKEIKDDDEFSINNKFSSKSYRVVIKQLKTSEENVSLTNSLEISRSHQ